MSDHGSEYRTDQLVQVYEVDTEVLPPLTLTAGILHVNENSLVMKEYIIHWNN